MFAAHEPHQHYRRKFRFTGAGANIPKNARVLLAIYIFVAPKLTRVADKLKIATEQGNESLF